MKYSVLTNFWHVHLVSFLHFNNQRGATGKFDSLLIAVAVELGENISGPCQEHYWFHFKKLRGQRNILLIQSISSCYLINLCEYWGPRGQSRCVRTGWKVSNLFQELLSHSAVLKTNHLFYSEHLGSQEIGAWISKSFHLISIFDCSTSSLHTPSCPSNGKVYGHLAIRIFHHQPTSHQLCSLRK